MKIMNNNILKLFMLTLITTVLFVASECNEAVSDVFAVQTPELESPVFESDLPDFSAINDIKEKKRSFFSFLRPIIEEENERVFKKRKRLLGLYKKHIDKEVFSPEELEWLDRLHAEYRINDAADDPEFVWTDSLRRVDTLPVELAMTQSAKESGWGTSRFARIANNIFGQQCFVKGCGVIPGNRDDGAIHEVRKFKSVKASVRSYIRNLNTNSAYEEFRQLRFDQRQAGEELDALLLVSGLPRYSVRGAAYLEEIRAMILVNRPIMGS